MAAIGKKEEYETYASMSRITVDGRKLTYSLKVIQQPERARACGSGAKSSADRRPVDPPPVVQLKIFEGEDAKNDITFAYNANFFLFATLELDRPIAPGRLGPSSPQIPVLTGMPVSGMAYLDRPCEAGYFIFPDLSVRHEGQYKLSFNLYEETKVAKDADAEPIHEVQANNSMPPGSSFDWRLEVQSKPFTVYSAKKFPGLAESTTLSRLVAEQGCRVRIRRDVRMRRRDGKGADNYDFEGAEAGYARARRTATPDAHDTYPRPRSTSIASGDRQSQYGGDNSRRLSGAEYPYQYPGASTQPSSHYAGSPPTPQSARSNYGGFGGNGAEPPYLAQQRAQIVAPQQSLKQPLPPPPPQTNYYQSAPSAYRQPEAPVPYGYEKAYSNTAYSSSNPASRDGYEYDSKRPSSAYTPTTPMSSQYSPLDPARSLASTSQQSYTPRAQTPVAARSQYGLPPISSFAHADEPLTSAAPKFPSLYNAAPRVDVPMGPVAAGIASLESQHVTMTGKRGFDTAFKSNGVYESLHNRMRPSSAHVSDDDDDDEDFDKNMTYSRADGRIASRWQAMRT